MVTIDGGSGPLSPSEVIDRLEVLMSKLDLEGLHVSVNTVWLAIETIKRLEAKEVCGKGTAPNV